MPDVPEATRNLYFGDLHVHTSYSFDAFGFGTTADPVEAYADAQGRLDFMAVTDHSEFLAETLVCSTPGAPGYDTAPCQALRAGYHDYFNELKQLCNLDPPILDPGLCADLAANVWQRIKSAANHAYVPGLFTTFIAYEYGLEREDMKLHRNVIFSGTSVPAPVSYFEVSDPTALWSSLREDCVDPGDCDVLVIPHTMNASRGTFFNISDGLGGYITVPAARLRARMEPLVEVYQHKGNSECYPGAGTNDEQCVFEMLPRSRVIVEPGNPIVPKLSFAREALKLGLSYDDIYNVNPFQFGFVGGTDSHNGRGGVTDEQTFDGHVGFLDDTIPKRFATSLMTSYSPGGLTGVWATENTREGIFQALKRREAYATSGTRIVARFFGGWIYTNDLCQNPQLPMIAYRDGVSMGSILPSPAGPRPRFIVTAQQDPNAAPLQKIQIVKAWTNGPEFSEEIYTVAESDNPEGSPELCVVWTDTDFDPARRAFYYARVLETATPRWTAYDCAHAGVDCAAGPPPQDLAGCCDGTVQLGLQERVWTSPIWYRP